MPAALRTPRNRWIDAGLRALADGGPDAVRVEALAAKMGVTKGGFYAHFENRAHLLAEMLGEWERRSTEDVRARVADERLDATERIRIAGSYTFSRQLLPIDLAVRAWARHDAAVAERLRRVDNVRMEYLREQFRQLVTDPDEVEARSTLAFTLAIGRHFLASDHGPYSRSQAVELAAARLLSVRDR